VPVVGVAQLVEPRIVIPVVVGSSPIVHPTSSFFLIIAKKSGIRHRHPVFRGVSNMHAGHGENCMMV
jgi:hypothetical protein